MSSSPDTTDRRAALVTGGGSGIGSAIVLAMARAGMDVVIAELDGPVGERTATEASAATGARVVSIQADVAAPGTAESVVRRSREQFGRLDVLVNNAGIARSIGFFDVTESDWDAINAVNARGSFFMMQAAAASMVRDGGGRIVNIASIGGKGWHHASSVAYVASKGAVVAMTRFASATLAQHDVTVNAVCPGLTNTAIFQQMMRERSTEAGMTYDEYVARHTTLVPLGRLNEPSDIADAVVFLASHAGRNITGQTLNVDGGIVWD